MDPPSSLAARLEQLVGRAALGREGRFDPSDATVVDRVAGALLQRFHEGNDARVFALLVELAGPELTRRALAVTRDEGVAVAPRELVADWLARQFVAAEPASAREGFLQAAERDLREDARARRAALADRLPAVDELVAEGTRATAPVAELGVRFAALVSTAFHRLEVDDRRLLLALEVDRLSHQEIAERFGLYQDEVAARIVQARGRLAGRIAAVFEALDPERREQP